LVKSFWVIAGAVASTEVKSGKVRRKNQAISFSFLGSAASKLLRAATAQASNAHHALVQRTFRKLATNHDLIPLYNKRFVSRLPTGERLNVAIYPQLEEAFKVLDDSEGAN
jgi:hypothetical protein